MKFLLVLVFVFISSDATNKELMDTYLSELKTVAKACLAETKAMKGELGKLISHEIPDSHEGKCLIACFHRHFKMQNEDGSFNREGLIASMEPIADHDPKTHSRIVELFDTCTSSVAPNADPCLYAAELSMCTVKEGKIMGLSALLLIE